MISSTKNRFLRTLSRTGFRARALVAIAVAGIAASACDVHGVSAPGTLASITVSPNTTRSTNGTQQMVAVGRDADGQIIGFSPTWSVAAGGGTISSTGLFTAGTVPGVFTNTVVASVGTIKGTASITVVPGALASITLVPTPVTMAVGANQTFVAVGKDASGNIVAFTPTWTVVAGGGTITQAGIFTASGVVGTYPNTVQVSNNSIKAFGTVTITAGPLATITVVPNPVTMPVNTTQQFVAVGKDASGNASLMTATWSVVSGGGVISPTGAFTAGGTVGTFTNTVMATSGTISGTATVTVTVTPPPPPPPATTLVNLGTAAPNGIMAGLSVTCITGGIINANVSISPGNTINGFGPCVITGVQHLADAVAAQGQIDLTAAYNTLAGLPCPPANAIVANLGGTTKPAGVYCTASGIGVTGTLTLDGGGDPNANFVFQAGSSLTTAGNIVLINGAQAKNVYWQVGSSATLGVSSQWQGNILALSSITMVDNATLLGRALARNGSVTLGTNNVINLP